MDSASEVTTTRRCCATGTGEPQTRVVALGAQRYSLHLCGALSPGWTGSLARELSVRRISIERGWARRSSGSRWEGQFDLRALDPGLDMFEVDFLSLARSSAGPRGPGPRPLLDAYDLEHTGQGVIVALCAADGVGLLDALLATFALYALFPHEMTIDTRGGVAHDLFRLLRVDGQRPSDVVAASLEATLRELSGIRRPAGPAAGSRRPPP